MAIPSFTFVFGIIVLAYLSSFVFFAILRITTGISIQRIGYFSLRRLAYTPRDGIRIEVRGLGINLHRPTFAQPTWLSVVLTEPAVTIDLRALENDTSDEDAEDAEIDKVSRRGNRQQENSKLQVSGSKLHRDITASARSKSWKDLNGIKNKIKRLHRKINWLRMIDLVATNSSITIIDVGTAQIGSFTMAVDTRRKTVDRHRIFSYPLRDKKQQRPAEWMLTLRSIFFTPEGRESLEILDHATLNIHGLLYKDLDGLQDAAVSLKFGRIHIPLDDIRLCMNRLTSCRNPVGEDVSQNGVVTDILVEVPPSSESAVHILQTVSDSKEFVSSILRGIKEVQFAVGYVAVSKKIETIHPTGSPLYLNASMKEVGVDLHRLDPRSPAHRMYFSPKDIAHQALVAALSLTLGLEDGQGKSDRLVYIPMVTTTVRTTLPSKTVEFVHDRSADDRNANILSANVVITSPSFDLDPKHLPLVLAMTQWEPRVPNAPHPRSKALISKLLPKANVKMSMHEPVIRIALPPVEKLSEDDEFDLIISSISSISLDVESSHSSVGDVHYSLASNLRVQSHDLYYQTSAAARYDLLQTESMELKVQIIASPEVNVVASGSLQTFSVRMIRPEISNGVRQIVRQLRIGVEPKKKTRSVASQNHNFIRALPPWLLHFQFQASDFSAEVAGVDSDISDDTRGIALQLESWTAEYRAQIIEIVERKPSRRRSGSRSLTPDSEVLRNMPAPSRKSLQNPTDGRRLAVHVRGLEGFVVESAEKWENEPFLAVPRFEVAFSTSSAKQSPIFHINSYVKTLLIQYSLYRHYATGVAATVLRRAFVRTKADKDAAAQGRTAATNFIPAKLLSPDQSAHDRDGQNHHEYSSNFSREMTTIDIKAVLLQIKADMPADPPVMLQIYGMEAGRHRWASPFLHAQLIRLYTEAPRMKHVWARIVSIKSGRVDLRENRRKLSNRGFQDERIIDVNTEAIRVAVPHQLVPHKIFDNFVNTLKAIQQLHHRFKTGTNEYILEKHPEGPKNVPKISIRSQALLFELEDGAFEWKLGTIYKAGLIEQQQRLAREEAFRVKAKRMDEAGQKRDSSRFRARTAQPRGRSAHKVPSKQRSKSDDDASPVERRLHHSGSHRRMRYDPEGVCGISSNANIPVTEAYEKLQRYNAESWKTRIDHSYEVQQKAMQDVRSVFWGPDQLPDDMEDTEDILEVPQRPALMATLVSDLHVMIDKPSFPLSQLPEYLHRIGKGMPYDMKYALLIPMHVRLDMGEARITLRDYPLPLLHVPAMKPGQFSRLPSWSLKTDFVIAEEFRGPQSMRHVKVNIVPPRGQYPGAISGGFAIDVRRTVSPVKSYSDISIEINTGFPTRITWGASYQPAIQDMMLVVEGFTKPQVDPSDRTGFWDKIRLSFHSRVLVAWRGDGDVHLMLKGTRDPYAVTGNGAGFLMCWRNDVRWNIWREDDPKKIMTVDSGDYILAIPDYSHQARLNEMSGQDDDSMASADTYQKGAIFKKVVMKLSGNVQWLAGLVFERTADQGQRSFSFIPHYQVILREPSFAMAQSGERYDAFRGFRSYHIHLSIAVKAPVNRDWSVKNLEMSQSYNSVHLTPRFFTHFFAWWSMFSGTMSLPIRQGRLWPGVEKSSKKFGRHLATIKYNLLLAPLFLSHIYKHKEAEDYSEDVVSATGIKIRLDSFMLDIHQRREQFNTQEKGRRTQSKTSGMRIHKAQLDLLSADIRAVSASIAGTTPEDLSKASASILVNQQDTGVPDLSHFVIPDNDFTWIDMDDFVELDWILPSEANPDTKIMPLAFAPRFTYFRQTDHADTTSNDANRRSIFGNEPTHFCIMSHDDDPRRVQYDLIRSRLNQLEQQQIDHNKCLGEAELKYIKDDGKNPTLKVEYEQMRVHEGVLKNKQLFLESMMHRMAMRIHMHKQSAVPDGDADCDSDGQYPSPAEEENDTDAMDTSLSTDFANDFNNRFVIHNMQMKWNNSLRNTILRYIHQVSQRRGFVYYLSRRAVKFILDIVEEQHRAKAPKSDSQRSSSPRTADANPETSHNANESPVDVEERIKELLADGKRFVSADDPRDSEGPSRISSEDLASNIGEEFAPQNSYLLRLIAPQIQLQSEKNPKSVVLVTAKGMELKVVEVMDKDRISDDVSGLVQRRFSVEMDSTQFFVTHQKAFSSQLLSLYSGSHYGSPTGSSWPPWVPMEVMFDFKVDPFGFKRVVQKTSASLRYDKYNTLRLKYNDEVGGDDKTTIWADNIDGRMDHLWVEFPQIKAICDSSQYYAMYIIVLDLLLYNEPLEKTRTERLEKIMLASDFSDLSGAPEMVVRLQERIRQLDEIKTQFQIHSKFLDKRGWEDRIALQQDLANCEDELFFMMKAITTSQRKYDGLQNNGLLRWNIASKQIVWHLMRDKDLPLMEFQLQNAEYDRTDNSDGSHVNLMQVGKIVGLNLLPDAIYPEMIVPYNETDRGSLNESGNQQMLRIYWYMLEAIAGIPVMDHFEVNLFPMKIQLEHEVGKRLFEYVFPGSGEKSSDGVKTASPFTRHMAPVQDENEDDDSSNNSFHYLATDEPEREDLFPSMRQNSLELRLKPTMNSESRPKASSAAKGKAGFHANPTSDNTHFRLFHGNRSQSRSRPPSIKSTSKKPSAESLRSGNAMRPGIGRSSTGFSTMDGSSTHSEGKSKRFTLHRNGKVNHESQKPSDDLSKMLTRASNYMTLAYVKIPSVVLCLSYKGRSERNLEDVHDFVFRLPMLEYRNKTWSNLDLALALKKDVIKALISHTGAIIGNKFTKSRPNTAQQSRLRELATSSTLLASSSTDMSHENSDASSTLGTSAEDVKPRDRSKSPRRSFASSSGRLVRTTSASSSGGNSFQSFARSPYIPSSMSMTSAAPKSRNGSFAGLSTEGDAKTSRSDTASLGAESESRSGGFMGRSIGRKLHALGTKIRDRSEASSSITVEGDEDEEVINRRSKLHLGGKMLGTLGEH